MTLAHRDDAFADGAVPDAYAMMSNLLDGIVGRVVPPFTLSKLEGDAVFAYAADSAPVPVHRLLKTGAAELVGHGAFALITAVAAARFDIPTEAAVPIVETYEHYPPISTHVFPLREV